MDNITQLTDKVYAVKVQEYESDFHIEVYSDSVAINYYDSDSDGWFDYILPPGQWRLIGNAKEVNEDVAVQLVEKHSSHNTYRAYNYGNSVYCSDPLYSLDSLLKSKECTDGEIILIEKIK